VSATVTTATATVTTATATVTTGTVTTATVTPTTTTGASLARVAALCLSAFLGDAFARPAKTQSKSRCVRCADKHNA